jgi:hypothetical protein
MSVLSARVFAQRGFRSAALSVALTVLTLGSASQAYAFANNFDSNFNGFEVSRPNPNDSDRAMFVPDPDGKGGRSFRLKLLKGDTSYPKFKTSRDTEPRAWISNHDGFTFTNNTKVRYTFSIRTPKSMPAINTNFAQVISDGTPDKEPDRPLWMLKTDGNRKLFLSIHYDNATKDRLDDLKFTLPLDKWVVFVVTFDLRDKSSSVIVKATVDGEQVASLTLTKLPYDRRLTQRICHWDGGIYHRKGTNMNTDRMLYIDDFKAEKL